MAYDTSLCNRIREYLVQFPQLRVHEQEMFRGLTFMVNDKMCISVSGNNLMCRFDPALQEQLAEKKGFQPMIMKGKEMRGYCYVAPAGFASKPDFEKWVTVCLNFNAQAKASKKEKAKKRA